MGVNHGLFALVFLLIVIKATAKQSFPSSTDPITLIKSLASRGRSPVIIVVQPEKSAPGFNLDELLYNDATRGKVVVSDDDEAAKEDAKNMLYEYLRSSPYDTPQQTKKKYALREALRRRCQKVTICVEDCEQRQYTKRPRRPTSYEYSCPQACNNNYDREQLCSSNNQWGSTMPPRWLF